MESARLVLEKIFGNIQKDTTFTSPWPLPEDRDMLSVLSAAKKVIGKEKTILSLQGEFEAVGDIHGDLQSLATIFEQRGLPNFTKYVFLGDYVDRGDFSIEVVLVLFSLKILYPDNIYILRGNHESSICKKYDFEDDCVSRVGKSFFQAVLGVFRILPLCAIVNDEIFCVHGGIPETEMKLEELADLERPAPKDYRSIVTDFLWSDPKADLTFEEFEFNTSRQAGNYYGPKALNSFLRLNNLKYVIRGHQVCDDGFDTPFENCVTIFSSADHEGRQNLGATCTIGEDKSISVIQFEKDLSDYSVFGDFINVIKRGKQVSENIVAIDEYMVSSPKEEIEGSTMSLASEYV